MKENYNRRQFVQTSLLTGAGLTFLNSVTSLAGVSTNRSANKNVDPGKRVGLIGLDTSHVTAITNALNNPKEGVSWDDYKVVAAFPTAGSPDIKASIDRLAGFTEKVRNQGVEIVNSIDELLQKVDVVLLESVDGRRHLAEALPVLKSGKRMFLDKPAAGSLADAMVIYDAAKKYNNPTFSASSLRYISGAKEVAEGKIGKVLGADAYGDCYIEPTHPDLFYYGIHGVEILYAVMGTGCKSVVRVHLDKTDMVVGTWGDDRIGSYRGTRSGTGEMGATVFGEKGIELLTKSQGYQALWVKVIDFFNTGVVPVSAEETLEELAFMEAADESKRKGGASVDLATIVARAEKKAKKMSY
jgi:predicted dehydrogenase